MSLQTALPNEKDLFLTEYPSFFSLWKHICHFGSEEEMCGAASPFILSIPITHYFIDHVMQQEKMY